MSTNLFHFHMDIEFPVLLNNFWRMSVALVSSSTPLPTFALTSETKIIEQTHAMVGNRRVHPFFVKIREILLLYDKYHPRIEIKTQSTHLIKWIALTSQLFVQINSPLANHPHPIAMCYIAIMMIKQYITQVFRQTESDHLQIHNKEWI